MTWLYVLHKYYGVKTPHTIYLKPPPPVLDEWTLMNDGHGWDMDEWWTWIRVPTSVKVWKSLEKSWNFKILEKSGKSHEFGENFLENIREDVGSNNFESLLRFFTILILATVGGKTLERKLFWLLLFGLKKFLTINFLLLTITYYRTWKIFWWIIFIFRLFAKHLLFRSCKILWWSILFLAIIASLFWTSKIFEE